MAQILAIAINTFREAIRNKVFSSLVLFSVVLMLLTLAVGAASLHEEVRLMKDIGLFLTSTFSVLIAIFVGVNLVYKEIERKTIYTVVPKPIYRAQFLVGKYLGMAATLVVQVLVMGGVLRLQFLVLEEPFGFEIVQALWLIYVEVLVVTGVAMLFSSFSTPLLSGLLTMGVFMVGRFGDVLSDLHLRAEKGQDQATLNLISGFCRTVAAVMPDLSLYNTTLYVVYDASLDWSYVVQATIYGLSYAGVMLLVAAVLFSRRDFT